jgi:hypothetical protein
MHANPPTRLSPKLVLYGFVFRILRSVAIHTNGRAPVPAPLPSLPAPCRNPRRRDRPAVSLELDAAQGGPLCPPGPDQ